LVSSVSEPLQAFLRESISSYEELEALLLLVRTRDRGWTDDEVADALKVPVDGIATALEGLSTVPNLLRVDTRAGQRRFQYAPDSDTTSQVVEELVSAYSEQRLAIVRLMSSNALDRVRSSAARRLANAFRIKGPKE
jgi:hypothetical protein